MFPTLEKIKTTMECMGFGDKMYPEVERIINKYNFNGLNDSARIVFNKDFIDIVDENVTITIYDSYVPSISIRVDMNEDSFDKYLGA